MPKLYASGVQDVWDYLAIELLGPSLDSLFRQSGHDVMDMRSVCAIAIQVVRARSFECWKARSTESSDPSPTIHASK